MPVVDVTNGVTDEGERERETVSPELKIKPLGGRGGVKKATGGNAVNDAKPKKRIKTSLCLECNKPIPRTDVVAHMLIHILGN